MNTNLIKRFTFYLYKKFMFILHMCCDPSRSLEPKVNTIGSLKIPLPVTQVLKQVVNLSCFYFESGSTTNFKKLPDTLKT